MVRISTCELWWVHSSTHRDWITNPLRVRWFFITLFFKKKSKRKNCEDIRSLKLSFDNGLPCDLGQINQEFQKLKDIYVTKLHFHLFMNKDFSSLKNEK